MRLLVVPGLIRVTEFQRAKDMYEPRMGSARFQDGLDAVFFAKVLFANEFDLETLRLRQLFCVLTNLVAQGLRELSVVKDANLVFVEIVRHAFGVAQGMQTPGQ